MVNNTGTDLGVKINAADKALGSGPGEIAGERWDVISTQVILSSDHTLHFMPGQYQTRTTRYSNLAEITFNFDWLRLGVDNF